MNHRFATAAFLSCMLLGIVPHPVATPRPISISINGELLPLNPPPLIERGHLFVPVRRTIQALGLDFSQVGDSVVTHVGARTVTLRKGRSSTVEIKSVLYAPLRFFTDVLGAQTTYDRKARTVTIVAQLVGRSGSSVTVDRGRTERIGTVSAVDVNSDPPTLTLTYNTAARTIPIGANATIEMRDVDAHVRTPGELVSIQPGDFAKLTIAKDGAAKRIEDEFGSRSGRIAAIGSGEFVLGNGQVIAPNRFTQMSLNGTPAQLANLRVGDRATVRYNVVTNEVREVLASRKIAAVAATATGPQITSITTNLNGALRAGQTFTVTMHGTSGAAASIDVGSYVTGLAMNEVSPGVYRLQYTIPARADFSDVPIIGHLRVQGVAAPALQAAQILWASSSPPGVSAFGPAQGSIVNTARPAIYATFAAGAVGVNPSSIDLRVNRRDITSECVRTTRFIQCMPSFTYRPGPVRVRLRVADRAGNSTDRSWTFKIVRP